MIKNIQILISNLISFISIVFWNIQDSFNKKETINSKKLLCVNTEKIGDLILSLDFLKSIEESGKYDEYFLLIDDNFTELLKSSNLKYQIISLNKKEFKFNPFYKFSFVKNIRSFNFYDVFNFTPERGSINEEITLSSGALRKFTIKESSRYINTFLNKYFNKFYSHIPQIVEINEYERLKKYLDFFEIKHTRSNVFEFKNKKSLFEFGDFVLVNPNASESKKNWDRQKYSYLINEISKLKKVLIIGSPVQKTSLDYFVQTNNVMNIAGNYKIDQLPRLIDNCLLFVGGDSGLSHIAHYLGNKTICICGGGSFGSFFPYRNNPNTIYFYNILDCFNCGWKCKFDKPYCLTEVKVETVLKEILKLIKN